ncbi:MAG: chlorosome envelope protein B [Chlorobaculum sp.]|jgi:chlorosome envelope protein B|nr:chlorosome envelope protein B [Chlorobaculum sp.]
MANEPVNQIASGVNNLADSVGKMSQVSVDMVTNVMNTSIDVFKTVNKISVDIAGNAINALNQALQGISSAIAPKK